MEKMLKYGLFVFVALVVAGVAIGADAILSDKSSVVTTDLVINEKVDLSQGAVEQAQKAGYADVSAAIKEIGVVELERRALGEEKARLTQKIVWFQKLDGKGYSTLIAANKCLDDVIATNEALTKEQADTMGVTVTK